MTADRLSSLHLPSFHLAAAALAAAAAVAPSARADPFDPARVPADAKYVVHVDMDALRPTKLWGVIDDRLAGNEAFGTKMGLFETASGMHFPRDLHGVTIYGRAAGDDNGVVVIRAAMHRDQFMAAIGFAPGYQAESFGKVDGASWDDDGRRMFGAFHDDATLVFARSAANVLAALDVIDGKSPHVAPTDPLAAGGKGAAGAPPALFYVAAADPASLAPPRQTNPLLKQVDAGWLTVVERPAAPATRPADGTPSPDAVVHAVVTAKTPEAAKQLQAAAGGVRAMVALAAMPAGADPNLKFASGVLRSLAVAQADRAVTADLSVGVDALQQAVDRAVAQADADRAGGPDGNPAGAPGKDGPAGK